MRESRTKFLSAINLLAIILLISSCKVKEYVVINNEKVSSDPIRLFFENDCTKKDCKFKIDLYSKSIKSVQNFEYDSGKMIVEFNNTNVSINDTLCFNKNKQNSIEICCKYPQIYKKAIVKYSTINKDSTIKKSIEIYRVCKYLSKSILKDTMPIVINKENHCCQPYSIALVNIGEYAEIKISNRDFTQIHLNHIYDRVIFVDISMLKKGIYNFNYYARPYSIKKKIIIE